MSSFESPRKGAKVPLAEIDTKRPSFAQSDDGFGSTNKTTPIKEKFKSIISKASHRSSTASFGSSNSKRKSFEVLTSRDGTNTNTGTSTASNKPSHLTIQTGASPDSDKKRESASTYSETSTEFNNTSPLPPGSIMDVDDDYEYYRYYYNYHQQQHQGATSHIIENLDSSESSEDKQDPKNSTIKKEADEAAAAAGVPLSAVEFRKRNIADEPISEETTKSSIKLSPLDNIISNENNNHNEKLDILSISTGDSNKRKHSDEENDQVGDIARANVGANIAHASSKRMSIPASTTTLDTHNTVDSFHSAASSISEAQNEEATSQQQQQQQRTLNINTTNNNSNNLLVPEGKNNDKRVSNDPRFSTNSKNTLRNIYASYLDELDGGDRRASSVYDSNRTSTLGPSSNRNTATPSVLDAMAGDLSAHPLPDINKYSKFASNSTISLKGGNRNSRGVNQSEENFGISPQQQQTKSQVSLIVDDSHVAYTSGVAPLHSSNSLAHSRSKSASSALSGSSHNNNSEGNLADIKNKRSSKVSENIIEGNASTNRLSQGFYFESEEPIAGSSNQQQQQQQQQQQSSSKRSSGMFGFGFGKLPTLSSPFSGPPRNFNRDTITTTSSSNYGSSSTNYRSSYQTSFANTNVTSPTDTNFRTSKQSIPAHLQQQPQYQQQQQGLSPSTRFNSRDYSTGGLRLAGIDNESKYDNYDRRLQELQTNLNEEVSEGFDDEDEDEEDIDEEDEAEHRLRSDRHSTDITGGNNNVNDNDDSSIFVPPYLNNTAHTQSSSFSSLRKNGQESFKSSKSNHNLNAATFAAAAAAAAAAGAGESATIQANHHSATVSNSSANDATIGNISSGGVPNLLHDDKKLFIRPVPYGAAGQFDRKVDRPASSGSNEPTTIRSTTNSAYPRPSTNLSSNSNSNTNSNTINNTFITPVNHGNAHHSKAYGLSPTTPFSPLSIQNDRYIKSINDESLAHHHPQQQQQHDKTNRNSSAANTNYAQGGNKYKHGSKNRLRPFHLRSSSSAAAANSPSSFNNHSGSTSSSPNVDGGDIEKFADAFGQPALAAAAAQSKGKNKGYGYGYDNNNHHDGFKICSDNTAVLLLIIGLFVPPLYLVMCFGFLDPSCGYISRKYKLTAAGLSILVTILSIVGICVGFGVGLA